MSVVISESGSDLHPSLMAENVIFSEKIHHRKDRIRIHLVYEVRNSDLALDENIMKCFENKYKIEDNGWKQE